MPANSIDKGRIQPPQALWKVRQPKIARISASQPLAPLPLKLADFSHSLFDLCTV
jgi:hypothetical protein